MNIKKIISLALVGALGTPLISGCTNGLRLWERGRYFQMEKAEDFEQREIKSIGVYVYSDGEARDGQNRPFDAMDIVTGILTLGMSALVNPPQMGLHRSFWTTEVKPSSSFEPDTSNSGPSLELANAIASELGERGYTAKAVTDLGHNSEISVAQVMKHAKDAGYDAAFIVHYAGLNKWTEYGGTTQSYRMTTIHIKVYEGYLYLPNATMFDTKTGDQLWKNSYYGLVERAHVMNLSNEPFFEAVSESMLYNGEETYIKSAPKAAAMLFNPEKWPQSVKEFPARGEKKRKL